MLLWLWSIGTGRNRGGEIGRELRSKDCGAGGRDKVSCGESGDHGIFQAYLAHKRLAPEVANGIMDKLRLSGERGFVCFTLDFASVPNDNNGVPKFAPLNHLRDRKNATMYRIHDLI